MLVSTTIGFVLALRHSQLRLRYLFYGFPRLSVTVLGVTCLCLLAITVVPMLAGLFSMGTLAPIQSGLLGLGTVGVVLLLSAGLKFLYRVPSVKP